MGCGASTEEEPPPATDFQWDEDDKAPEPAKPAEEAAPAPKKNLKKKRASVSAECMELNGNVTKKVVPKSDDAKAAVKKIVDAALLMKHLDVELKTDIVNATREVEYKAGVEIITQGDVVAEDFYMLSTGECQAFVNGTKVMDYSSGGCFGELALMYTAPRAATVKAVTDCMLFALDRQTFREVVINSVAKRKQDYEKFLMSVPIFASMQPDELNAIADVLIPSSYAVGDTIVSEGDAGDLFFLLEEGEVTATKSDGSLNKVYKRGEYFGELALLEANGGTRQATVKASTPAKVAMLDKAAFKRLLGPLEPILRRNAELYEKYVAPPEDQVKELTMS